MKDSPLKTQWPWFNPRSWGQLKHNILLHMCFIQTLVIRCTVYEMLHAASWKLCDLEFTFKGHPLKVMRSIERSYMTISYTLLSIYENYSSFETQLPLKIIQGQRSWGQLEGNNIWLLSLKHWSYDASFMRFSLLKILWPWFHL